MPPLPTPASLLSLLQFHFCPLAFSLESLQSLPYGTNIPTMASGKSLIVTTSDSNEHVSINNVTINGSPIFDDRSLVVFGIDKLFDLNFEVSSRIHSPSSDRTGVVSNTTSISASGAYSFDEASGMMRSRGYSVMASFLDLQLVGLVEQLKLTVFAPVDDAMLVVVGNFSEYSSVFLRHVAPCKLSWTDLANFENGTVLRTFSEFTIKIMKSSDQLMLNEAPVTFPDMYHGDWLVVHGLNQVLERTETLMLGV
ncbi:hypothetical protein Acr_25g0003370 [Actinidia rufa]|uniref:FAS1 domain-containing protein n=1 Tax=Actinidia rufa TaxID=165716 RepID=A0A7J0GYW1_9ERIC|nr:hypothetical protein Acr_25g0003370 [Actinidia rufa]